MSQRIFCGKFVTICSLAGLLWHGGEFRPEAAEVSSGAERKLLYVATPGIRDELEYGGHGILVFDIDDGHKFLRRISAPGLNENGKPLNVKGICANVKTRRLYVSTTRTLVSFDLVS